MVSRLSDTTRATWSMRMALCLQMAATGGARIGHLARVLLSSESKEGYSMTSNGSKTHCPVECRTCGYQIYLIPMTRSIYGGRLPVDAIPTRDHVHGTVITRDGRLLARGGHGWRTHWKTCSAQRSLFDER